MSGGEWGKNQNGKPQNACKFFANKWKFEQMERSYQHLVQKKQNGKVSWQNEQLTTLRVVACFVASVFLCVCFIQQVTGMLVLQYFPNRWEDSFGFLQVRIHHLLDRPTKTNSQRSFLSSDHSGQWYCCVTTHQFNGFHRSGKPAFEQTKSFVCNNATKLFTTPEA